MKRTSVFYTLFVTAFWLSSFASAAHPMREVMEAMDGYYVSGKLPDGFADQKLQRQPQMKESFKAYLKGEEQKKATQYREFIETSEDFEDLTAEQKKAKWKNPTKDLNVRYLIEIGEVYKIYHEDEHVGYVYRTSDHVQAAIYNDSAGIEIFVDKDQNVIGTGEWSA